ncbi:MAG: hypothetical protein QM581_16870 [Pseudomonas sp.]
MNEALKAVICAIPLVFVLGACLYALDRACRQWHTDDWPWRVGRLLRGLDRPLKRIGLLLLVIAAVLLGWEAFHLVADGDPERLRDPLSRWPLAWGGGLVLAAVALFVLDAGVVALSRRRIARGSHG